MQEQRTTVVKNVGTPMDVYCTEESRLKAKITEYYEIHRYAGVPWGLRVPEVVLPRVETATAIDSNGKNM